MKRIGFGYSWRERKFAAAAFGVIPGGEATGIWLEDGSGELQALCLFDQYNEASIAMHIAAVPGSSWLNRQFLSTCFGYPFHQLQVRKVIGLVSSANLAARRFDEHLGFALEATLKDAHPEGDLLVYSMTREQCRWLNMKVSKNGQSLRTPAA